MSKKSKKIGEKPSGAAPKPLSKIVIAGKEYPCRVTMGALLRFKRATGHDVSEMDYEDMEELMVFVHSCVTSACKADGVEFGLDVMDLADQLEPDALNSFYAAMGGGESGESGESGEKGESEPSGGESEADPEKKSHPEGRE